MKTETMTRQEVDALRERGWRVYDAESTKYDVLVIREHNEKTITRHIKFLVRP